MSHHLPPTRERHRRGFLPAGSGSLRMGLPCHFGMFSHTSISERPGCYKIYLLINRVYSVACNFQHGNLCNQHALVLLFWHYCFCSYVTWYCFTQLQYPVYWDLLEFCDGFRKLLDHLQLDKVWEIYYFIHARWEITSLFHNLFFCLCAGALVRCISGWIPGSEICWSHT